MPNLLFITSDQQRWDTLPCYGLDFIQTPNLDRIAREGLVFENAVVPAPLCVPCRAALLSGQYPATTGTGKVNLDHVPLWPEQISAHHQTVAVGKMHFNPFDATGGFQERIIAEDKRHIYLPDDHVKFLREHDMERFHPTEKPRYFKNLGASITPRPKRFHIDAFVGDQAADWIEKNGHNPFAAWVSFPGPHDPYDPPEEMAELYYDAPIPDPIRRPTAEEQTKRPPSQGKGYDRRDSAMYQYNLYDATPEHYRLWRAHYYANITLIDEGVGKMLAALEAVNALENTLIIYTSDHGDALGDHGLCLKSFFYDSMVHVPLLMRGPGVPAGQRTPALVNTIDLVPLFYQTCGIDPLTPLEGQDLSPILEDPSASIQDYVFSELNGRAMIMDHRYKYAHYRDGSAELFDRESDAQELFNQSGNPQYREIEYELRGCLLEHTFGHHTYQARAIKSPPNPYRQKVQATFENSRLVD